MKRSSSIKSRLLVDCVARKKPDLQRVMTKFNTHYTKKMSANAVRWSIELSCAADNRDITPGMTWTDLDRPDFGD